MSRFHHKGAGGQFRRPRYAALNFLESLIEPGIYSGFYDIVQPDGALDINGVWTKSEGDQVVELPQLLPSGTASSLVFKTIPGMTDPLVPNTYLTYRRGVQLSAEVYSNPRIPFLYYPRGMWEQIVADGTVDSTEMGDGFHLGSGTLGTPEGWAATGGFTYGFFGCSALTELGNFLQTLAGSGGGDPFAAINQFPAPETPGTVVFRGEIVGDNLVQTVYVNGVLAQTTSTALADTTLDNPNAVMEIYMLVGLFCWAVQKYFVITKPLTQPQILELHEAFVGTMEIYV